MSIPIRIEDGERSGRTAVVLSEGEILVNNFTCPPLLPQKNIVWGQKFTTDGTPAGTSEMGVDGSTTAVEYYIPAHGENDTYITRLSFIMGYGASAQLWEFADADTALTNGVKVSYTSTYRDEITIMNPTANYSFHRASDAPIGHNNWEDRGFAAAGDYGYFANISLQNMIPKLGVKLDRGTNQRMTITIRDDCTDADLFNCRAFGFQRFE